MNWVPESLSAWHAEDDRYRYDVWLTGANLWYGGIRSRESLQYVFTGNYISSGAAKADLEARGRNAYFVIPQDVRNAPPPVVVPESEEVPVTEPPAERIVATEADLEPEPVVYDPLPPTPDQPESPIESVKGTMSGHTVEVYRDGKGEYRWRRRAANHKNISNGSEGYSSKAACLHGLRLANQDSNHTVVDLTNEENQ